MREQRASAGIRSRRGIIAMSIRAFISFIIYVALSIVLVIQTCVDIAQGELLSSIVYCIVASLGIFLTVHKFAEWREILRLQKESDE